MAQVAAHKIQQVEDLVQILDANAVIGIVNVSGIPGPQIQAMRASLRGRKMSLRVAKLKLLSLAIENSNHEGLDQLKPYLDGQAGLIACSANPFQLFKELEGTLTPSPAKGGEKAPRDIIIPAGETSFKPGPIVGEFQKVGIPAAIEKGKVVIKKDMLLVAEGDVISRDEAQMLTKLEIYPMTVGLNLQAAWESGTVFEPSVLRIDDVQFMADLMRAHLGALGLAVEAAYPSKGSIKAILARASRESRGLSLEAVIPTSETIGELLARAQRHLLGLASAAPDGASDAIRTLLSSAPAPAVAESADPSASDNSQEDDDDDEASEEDTAAGLGALFD